MRTCVGVIVAIVLLTGIVSCSRTIYVPVDRHRIEQVVWHDTMVEVVHAGEVVHSTTIDTISELHTPSASSKVVVTDGVLSHTLTEHPRHDSVIVKWREVYITDSIPYPIPMIEESSRRWPSLRFLSWVIGCIVLLIVIVGLCFRGSFTR